MPKAQVGFIDFLVLPMYDVWINYLKIEDTKTCLIQLKANRDTWKKKEQLELAQPAK